ncbi:MAG: RNA polymerase sigma factor RpoD/SigA [Acidobacteria bacterium]|jgi:RNA polymerase primary sigma factor|nr:RNA polymerase sigma factor RpoD/SigA [Acidobacteriota bacterium]
MKKRKSNESLDSLNLYFQRIKKIKILTPEEERELITRAKDGDEDAFRAIIVANQRLVVREALKYYFKGDNFLDLINEGNKGLIEALKKFDLKRENRFFTYALWWVRSEIRRYLSKNQNIISLPDIFYNDYLNFKKAYFKLSKKLKRHPSEKELAEALQIPEKKVKVMLAVPDEIISLDKGISDDNSSSLTTFLPDDSVIDPQDILIGSAVRDLVREDIEKLTAREAEIIRLRFGFQGDDPQKLREIAKQLKMSPEGIRRIEIKALAKLKNQLRKQGIYGALN